MVKMHLKCNFHADARHKPPYPEKIASQALLVTVVRLSPSSEVVTAASRPGIQKLSGSFCLLNTNKWKSTLT